MIEELVKALRSDVELRYGWQSNIAMAFVDEVARHKKATNSSIVSEADLPAIANAAANNFLFLLCSQPAAISSEGGEDAGHE